MSEAISKRLFIGNVHSNVKEDELKSRFGSFGTVKEVELRSKNDDHFAFMNMVFDDIHAMRKCVDTLNNTRWKGLTLKVQYAKESFLEKLKRERALGQQGQDNQNSKATPTDGPLRDQLQRKSFKPERPRPPPNFNFEIVGTSDINTSFNNNRLNHAPQPKPTKLHPPKFVLENEHGFASNLVGFEQAGIINAPRKKGTKNEDNAAESKSGDLDNTNSTPEKIPSKVLPAQKPDIEDSEKSMSISVPVSVTSPKSKQKKVSPAKPKKRNHSDPGSDDSEDDDSSADEKDGIPKFRGLASFGASLFSGAKTTPNLAPEPETVHSRPLSILPVQPAAIVPDTSSAVAPPTNGFKLKVNPHKKAKSDELRLKSLTARGQQLNQRSNIIRHSLSQGRIEPPSVPDANSRIAGNNEALFADDEDADEETEGNDISFSVKPQYEGATGQKMLKLKSKYGGDSRFQLDERFADTSSIEASSILDTSEKNLQLEVLEKLMGPTATVSKPIPKPTAARKSFIRFDPTLPEHQKLIINPETSILPAIPPVAEIVPDPETTISDKKKKKLKQKEAEKAIDEEKAKLRDPTAKPTFKVAENLKTLFSKESEPNTGCSFSILQKFGTTETSIDKTKPEQLKSKSKTEKPRDNWNKNPFKYDSSDDEDDKFKVTDSKKVKRDGPSVSTPIADTAKHPGAATAKHPGAASGAQSFFKKESFFFTEKDERLKGVFEQFLKSDENLSEVSKKFNESGRHELKAIAQSKMKNAKRKGEKKMNFMKLLRKKKKREALAKQKKNEERRALFQSKNQE